jgi:hypothetical protein
MKNGNILYTKKIIKEFKNNNIYTMENNYILYTRKL